MRPLLLILPVLALLLATPARCANLATTSGLIVLTEGESGLALLNRTTFDRVNTLPPPEGFTGIHDVSAPEGSDLLFALDAEGGVVGVYTNAGSLPQFREDSVQPVSVGPFAGVSAASERMVVSGGTGDLSVFSYSASGEIELLANGISLGTGQPDVLLSPAGGYAYVSTDFSTKVDGAEFGITTIDLENPTGSGNTVGLPGAGFTPGGGGPANFPVEAAVTDEQLLVAHGGGLSILSLADPADPSLVTTVDVGFPAVNVDAAADGSYAVVVGSTASARVDLPSGTVTNLDVEDLRDATAVNVVDGTAVIADDEVLLCDRKCLGLDQGSGGSTDGDSGNTDDDSGNAGDDGDNTNGDSDNTDGDSDNTGGDNNNDNDNDGDAEPGEQNSSSTSTPAPAASTPTPTPESDICVEERYLLSQQIPRSSLLHSKGTLASVFCPGHGLPCGTPSHFIRFEGEYMTYKEVCGVVECTQDRRVVNGVSMRYARHLCGKEGNCVIPHVMKTGHWLERALIRGLHTGIVRW